MFVFDVGESQLDSSALASQCILAKSDPVSNMCHVPLLELFALVQIMRSRCYFTCVQLKEQA